MRRGRVGERGWARGRCCVEYFFDIDSRDIRLRGACRHEILLLHRIGGNLHVHIRESRFRNSKYRLRGGWRDASFYCSRLHLRECLDVCKGPPGIGRSNSFCGQLNVFCDCPLRGPNAGTEQQERQNSERLAPRTSCELHLERLAWRFNRLWMNLLDTKRLGLQSRTSPTYSLKASERVNVLLLHCHRSHWSDGSG